MDQPWRERIVCDAGIHQGEPCVRGTRIRVAMIVAGLADLTPEQLIAEYPQLVRDDITACLFFAAEASHSSMVA